jgi:hypothetical protein
MGQWNGETSVIFGHEGAFYGFILSIILALVVFMLWAT